MSGGVNYNVDKELFHKESLPSLLCEIIFYNSFQTNGCGTIRKEGITKQVEQIKQEGRLRKEVSFHDYDIAD